jgi:hypothetical protein
VDNGSKDDSLDYLRSLDWIFLLERPEEVHTNFPANVFTAWNQGLINAIGDFFVTMHSDVFVRANGWLDPMLREIQVSPSVAGAGAWKLHLENPLYVFQKRVTGYVTKKVKQALGMKKNVEWKIGHYPRDYCAIYRTDIIRKNNFNFKPVPGAEGGLGRGGGYCISTQIWNAGYETRMVDVEEMRSKVVHIAHGTAAVREEKSLRHQRKQKKLEQRAQNMLNEKWVRQLVADDSLDQ